MRNPMEGASSAACCSERSPAGERAPSLVELPDDLLPVVLDFLPLLALLSAARTCRTLAALASPRLRRTLRLLHAPFGVSFADLVSRPRLHDRVRVIDPADSRHGRIGRVVTDDCDAQPYRLVFDSTGTLSETYYRELQVALMWRPKRECTLDAPASWLCRLSLPQNMRNAVAASFHDRALGDGNVAALGDAFRGGALHCCRELRLSGNRCSDEAVVALADAFSQGGTPKLTFLSLYNNRIGDVGTVQLAKTLGHGALPQISVRRHAAICFELGAQSARRSPLSTQFPVVQVLLLNNNRIGDAGIVALAEAARCEALRHLPIL